jgi:hypothetical protein
MRPISFGLPVPIVDGHGSRTRGRRTPSFSVAPNPPGLTPENVEFIAMHTRGVGYFAVGSRLLKSTSDAAAR